MYSVTRFYNFLYFIRLGDNAVLYLNLWRISACASSTSTKSAAQQKHQQPRFNFPHLLATSIGEQRTPLTQMRLVFVQKHSSTEINYDGYQGWCRRVCRLCRGNWRKTPFDKASFVHDICKGHTQPGAQMDLKRLSKLMFTVLCALYLLCWLSVKKYLIGCRFMLQDSQPWRRILDLAYFSLSPIYDCLFHCVQLGELYFLF